MRLAVAFVVLLSGAMPLRGSEGLDLILLLDRSTSMSGAARLTQPLLRLTADVLARSATMDRVDHRLGLVTFGRSPRVDIPLRPPEPTTWPRVVKAIRELPGEARGGTDIVAALDAAARMFDASPADPSRRRSIVLVTDGVPYVRGSDMAAYREELRRAAARLVREGVTLDVLLLVTPGRHAGARMTFWRELAHGVEVTEPAVLDSLPRAHGIIARLAGIRTVESAPAKGEAAVETLTVAPYLEVVVLDVFRGSRDADLQVFAPGASAAVRGGVDGVEVMDAGEVLTTLVIPHPAPGQWVVRKSRRDARVRIVSEQFFPRGTLIAPTADAPRQYDRVPIAYRVVDANGRAVAELRDYALSLEVTLTEPDSTSRVVAMERDPGHAPGLFVSSVEADCDLAGRYWTDVRITTTDDAGRRIDVFRDRWSGFSVIPATRIDCRVTTSGATWSPPSARVECVDERRRPVELRAIAASDADLFRAVLTREGKPTNASLLLRYRGGGSFEGWLWGALRGGAYQLRLGVDRTRLRPPYNVRFVPPQLSFVRRVRLEWLAISLVVAAAIFIVRRRATKS